MLHISILEAYDSFHARSVHRVRPRALDRTLIQPYNSWVKAQISIFFFSVSVNFPFFKNHKFYCVSYVAVGPLFCIQMTLPASYWCHVIWQNVNKPTDMEALGETKTVKRASEPRLLSVSRLCLFEPANATWVRLLDLFSECAGMECIL